MKTTQTGGRYAPTRREHRHAESTEDGRTIVEAASAGSATSQVDRLEAQCRTILEAAGLPADDARVRVQRGDEPIEAAALTWAPHTKGDKPEPGWTITSVYQLAEGAAPILRIDSLAGYACRILHRLHIARQRAEHGDTVGALDWTLDAGVLAGEARFAQMYAHERRTTGRKAWARERRVAIDTAAEAWHDDSAAPIREVVSRIKVALHDAGLSAPETDDAIKRWLTKAASDGQLTIPSNARKGGRPPKTP